MELNKKETGMKMNFIKTSPAQNMTILVRDILDRSMHWTVAQKLMRYDSIHAEQVGFIESAADTAASARLQMMGGEFCGNATMSLAAVVAKDTGLNEGETLETMLEVSGADSILKCEVSAQGDVFVCKAEMPPPKEIAKISFTVSGSPVEADIVHLPGISHIIVDAAQLSDQKAFAEEAIAELSEKIKGEAFGIMFFDEAKQFMVPVVYVRDIGAPIWERSCASGTAAVGTCMASRDCKDTELEVGQPGGAITVIAKNQGSGTRLWIKTGVRIVAEGVAYV
ncbi:MAG: hypothetical protein FWG42_03195 [Clostridiales bacterium]|nr:hypothetical protein [Clostridiales bacterium]